MNQACVSLEDVFAAVGARAASLVPETSGYLALAVADATSRLPYMNEDRAVLLTVDGAIMVPRKGPIASPPEAGKALRDMLRRLLSASAGSMPGLASSAKPREETDVERVVSDIEAALIPVNRAAAKRALARLARETLKAKEAGKLRKKVPAVKPPAEQLKAQPTRHAAPEAAPTAPSVDAKPAAPINPQTIVTAVAPPMLAPAPTIAAPIQPPSPPNPPNSAIAPMTEAPAIAPPPMIVAPPPYVAAFDASYSAPTAPANVVEEAGESIAVPAPEKAYTSTESASAESAVNIEAPALPPILGAYSSAPTSEPAYTSSVADLPREPVYTIAASNAPSDPVYTFSSPPASDDEAYTSAAPSLPHEVAYTTSNDELVWQNADATVADPQAFAVFEAGDDSATAAGSLVAPKDLGLSPPPFEIAFNSEPTAGSLTDEDDEALTRPWHAEVAPIVAPVPPQTFAAQLPAQSPAFSQPVPPRVDLAQLDPPTAIPPETGLFSEPAGSRADELLENFGAENHGEPAVLEAARGLRAFAGIDATPAPHPDRARPQERQLPTYARRAAEQRSLRRFEDDEDEILPQPRSAQPQRSRWPLAVFALGILALFAAWLYRPSLAHDLFGLQKWVHLPGTNAATSPESNPAAAPQASPRTDSESTPAVSPRARDSKSESGDGAHRRRD